MSERINIELNTTGMIQNRNTKHLKLALVMLLTLVFGSLIGQDKVICSDWEEAKMHSREANKLILIDFYTDWCAPCKVFDKEVETDEAFATPIFQDFILFKCNAELESNHFLTRKYFPRSYPTFIVIDEEHNLVNKQYGGIYETDLEHSKKHFIAFLKESLQRHEDQTKVPGISNDFDLDYPSFYLDSYAGLKVDRNEVRQYWMSNPNKLTEVSFAIFNTFESPKEIEAYYMVNRDSVALLFGKFDAYKLLVKYYENELYQALENNNEARLDSLLKLDKAELHEDHFFLHFKFFKISLLMNRQSWDQLYDLLQLFYYVDRISKDEIKRIIQDMEQRKVAQREIEKIRTLLD